MYELRLSVTTPCTDLVIIYTSRYNNVATASYYNVYYNLSASYCNLYYYLSYTLLFRDVVIDVVLYYIHERM